LFFIALALNLVPAMGAAGTVNGSFRISLTVSRACGVQTPSANHSPVTDSSSSARAVDVSCTKDTPAAIYLDGDRVPVTGRGLGQPFHLSISSTTPSRQFAPTEQVVHIVY
jgi:spore coat protein U-like protein